MSSEEQINANRANATVSAGPKTAAGKARSACNAKRRHGLRIPVLADPSLSHAAKSMPAQIALSNKRFDMESALQIAEAQIDVQRVRNARTGVLNAVIRLGDAHPKQPLVPEVVEKLLDLDRYERRAMSRRNSVIRKVRPVA
jgi:hypothetical protein